MFGKLCWQTKNASQKQLYRHRSAREGARLMWYGCIAKKFSSLTPSRGSGDNDGDDGDNASTAAQQSYMCASRTRVYNKGEQTPTKFRCFQEFLRLESISAQPAQEANEAKQTSETNTKHKQQNKHKEQKQAPKPRQENTHTHTHTHTEKRKVKGTGVIQG